MTSPLVRKPTLTCWRYKEGRSFYMFSAIILIYELLTNCKQMLNLKLPCYQAILDLSMLLTIRLCQSWCKEDYRKRTGKIKQRSTSFFASVTSRCPKIGTMKKNMKLVMQRSGSCGVFRGTTSRKSYEFFNFDNLISCILGDTDCRSIQAEQGFLREYYYFFLNWLFC